MLDTENTILIRRRVEDVYRYVATDFFDNYPKWSPEVSELEKLSTGSMRAGVTGRQVRLDGGYRSEALFQVTHYTPCKELRFASLTKPYFEVCYLFESVAADTRLTFSFKLELPMLLRPLRSRIGATVERGGGRVVKNLKGLLEKVDGVGSAERGAIARLPGRTTPPLASD